MPYWIFYLFVGFCGCHGYRIIGPDSLTAFQGDVKVVIVSEQADNVTVHLMRDRQILGQKRIESSAGAVNASLTFACTLINQPGTYTLRVVSQTLPIWQSTTFDVTWPPLVVKAPKELTVYQSALRVDFDWSNLSCPLIVAPNLNFSARLIYCGMSDGTCDAYSPSQVRATVQNLNLWRQNEGVKFECGLLSRPGIYRVFLYQNNLTLINVSESIHVKASPDFQVQVRPRSIFPCGREVHVTYSSPPCAGTRDRIRLYGKRYNNVSAAISTPFQLTYIEETHLVPTRKILAFPCELFVRNGYDAYCFRYVSVADDHAVMDVAETCIPASNESLPTSDTRWAAWSSWSSCTGSCVEGIRYRYRYCNTKAPAVPGLYCKGSPIQSESCRLPPCATTSSPLDVAPSTNGVFSNKQMCQCGCLIYLNQASITLVASDTNCANKTLIWRIRAAASYAVRIDFRYVRLDCSPSSILWVRNGVSPSAELLSIFTSSAISTFRRLNSTSNIITVQLNSSANTSSECISGFIVHLQAVPAFTNVPEALEHHVSLIGSARILDLPVWVLLCALFAVLLGTMIMAILYSKFGLHLKHAQVRRSETKLSSEDYEEYETLSTTSILSMSNETLVPMKLGKKAKYQTSLPSSPCLRKKRSSGAQMNVLRRSMTSSPQTLRRWVQSNLNITVAPKERSESAHLLKSTCEQNIELCSLDSKEHKVINTADEVSSIDDNEMSTLKTTSENTISASDHDLDLEIDYYDFDVHNAGDAPDSFLRSYWSATGTEELEFSDIYEDPGTPTNQIPFADDGV